MAKTNLLIFALLLVVLAAIAAKSANQYIAIRQSPVSEDPAVSAGSLGGTATQAIANCANTTEGYTQRLTVQNLHASNDLCVYWVAHDAACGSAHNCDRSGTDDGILLLAERSARWDVYCDLKTCLVASATDTVYHVSQSIYP